MKNEATISDENKLYISCLNGKLWRNNCGVAFREDGVPVRFGLGNESQKTHDVFRSSDQIGILPVVITPDMVGNTVGVFVAVEDKKSDWTYTNTKHHRCQKNFLDQVKRLGGIGVFATGTHDIQQAILDFHRRFIQ